VQVWYIYIYIYIYCKTIRGSAIAKIVGANVTKFADKFEEKVTMYVYEEMIDGKKLTEIINETHENIKYLPGHKLPPNIVSMLIFLINKF
jgi:glycerol-3-phosphate dehydrogenase (NAD+)